MAFVQGEVDDAMQTKGKPLTFDERQEIIDRAVLQGPDPDAWLWGTKHMFELTPEQRRPVQAHRRHTHRTGAGQQRCRIPRAAARHAFCHAGRQDWDEKLMAAWDQDLDDAPRAAWEKDLDASGIAEQRTSARANALQPAAPPDAAASAVRLSRQTGLPFDLVQRNHEQVQRRVTADTIEANTSAASALRERYTDPAFAAVAGDDSGPLSKVEDILGAVAQFGRSILASAGPRFGAAAYGAAAYPFEAVGLDSAGGALRDLQRQSNAVADRLRGSLEGAGLLRRGIMSGGESAGQALVTLPLGWARSAYVTGEQMLLGAMGAQTFGQAYGKGRAAGASVAKSAAYGAQDAVAEVVTERFLGAAKLVADAKAGTGLVKLFLRDIAREIPGEGLATVWQNFNEWANLNPDNRSARGCRSSRPRWPRPRSPPSSPAARRAAPCVRCNALPNGRCAPSRPRPTPRRCSR